MRSITRPPFTGRIVGVTKRNRSRRWRSARGLFLITLLSGVFISSASAASVAQLPLGSDITSLTLAPDGSAWVAIENGKHGPAEIGHALAGGGFVITTLPLEPNARIGFGSPAALGPDGHVWLGGLASTLYRVDGDHDVIPVGPFENAETGTALALGPDGTLWDASSYQTILHVRTDGTFFTTSINVAPCTVSFYSSMVMASEGAMWLADYPCARTIRLAPSGAVSVIELGHDVFPLTLAPAPAESVWFVSGGHVAVGRISAEGEVARFGPLGGSEPNGGLAATSDGTAWYSSTDECGITQLTATGEQRHVSGPIVPDLIAFGPDGSVWLASTTRLVHTTLLALEHDRGGCDDSPPRVTLRPSLLHPTPVDSLEDGFSVTISKPAVVDVNLFFDVNGKPSRSLPEIQMDDVVVRSHDRHLHFGVPIKTLAQLRRDVAGGSHPTIEAFVHAYDSEGNGRFAARPSSPQRIF
jgi:streptogramin lyase